MGIVFRTGIFFHKFPLFCIRFLLVSHLEFYNYYCFWYTEPLPCRYESWLVGLIFIMSVTKSAFYFPNHWLRSRCEQTYFPGPISRKYVFSTLLAYAYFLCLLNPFWLKPYLILLWFWVLTVVAEDTLFWPSSGPLKHTLHYDSVILVIYIKWYR